MLTPETHYRIGNLVKDFGGNIVPIIRLTAGKQPLETPVHLTEDLFPKLGFKLIEGSKVNWYKNILGIAITDFPQPEYMEEPINYLVTVCICPIDGTCQPMFRHKNIKYVHELQNLFFAMTGEELIYTP